MRRTCLILLGLSLVLGGLTARADNDQAPSGHNALRKLGRGCANLLFGIVEIPNQWTKAQAENGGAAGATYGLSKGIFRWFEREFVGVYEIITFPVPFPKEYKPVMKPEWPNEDYEP